MKKPGDDIFDSLHTSTFNPLHTDILHPLRNDILNKKLIKINRNKKKCQPLSKNIQSISKKVPLNNKKIRLISKKIPLNNKKIRLISKKILLNNKKIQFISKEIPFPLSSFNDFLDLERLDIEDDDSDSPEGDDGDGYPPVFDYIEYPKYRRVISYIKEVPSTEKVDEIYINILGDSDTLFKFEELYDEIYDKGPQFPYDKIMFLTDDVEVKRNYELYPNIEKLNFRFSDCKKSQSLSKSS